MDNRVYIVSLVVGFLIIFAALDLDTCYTVSIKPTTSSCVPPSVLPLAVIGSILVIVSAIGLIVALKRLSTAQSEASR